MNNQKLTLYKYHISNELRKSKIELILPQKRTSVSQNKIYRICFLPYSLMITSRETVEALWGVRPRGKGKKRGFKILLTKEITANSALEHYFHFYPTAVVVSKLFHWASVS